MPRHRTCATAGTRSLSGWTRIARRAQQAKADGMVVVAPDEAAKRADWIQILTPDETQGELYESVDQAASAPGKVLGVSHGFSIHFKTIVPPTDVDVVMIAPKSPGHLVRRVYTRRPRRAVADRDPSGCQRKSARTRLSLMRMASVDPRGRSADHFQGRNRERSVWRAGGALRRTDFADQERIRNAGGSRLQPEIAYFECLHEMKLIVDLIYEGGLGRMRYSISNTAEYGDLTRGEGCRRRDARRR